MLKRNGFTILECIVSLLVLVMISGLIQFVIPMANKFNTHSWKDTTDWYLFLKRVEDPAYKFRLVKVTSSCLELNSMVNGENYFLLGGKKAVYLKTMQGGYMPLLVNYEPYSLTFYESKPNSVMVSCKLDNGEEKNAKISFQQER